MQKKHLCRSSYRELRQLNKSVNGFVRFAYASYIAYGSDFRLRRVKDFFNISATKRRNLTQNLFCISLLATRLKI